MKCAYKIWCLIMIGAMIFSCFTACTVGKLEINKNSDIHKNDDADDSNKDSTSPEETQPEETTPDATESDITPPQVTEPTATEPNDTEPEATEPTTDSEKPPVGGDTGTDEPEPTTPPTTPDEPDNTPDATAEAYLAYYEMSADEQLAFINSFPSMDAFFAWHTAAKEAYESERTPIDGSNPLG